MKTNLELRAERIRQNKSISHMANLIGKSKSSYYKKEMGEVPFTTNEIVIVVNELDLPFDKFNLIFFSGHLPFSKSADCRLR